MPRQITSFEFKLIGFMTLHQFLYLIISFPLGFIVYKLFPIPIINIALGAVVALFGVALAFLPINERPLDVWIKNLIRRLNSPTQYLYHKNNSPLTIFKDLFFVSDPHRVMAHVESQKKLSAYLVQTKQTMTSHQGKVNIQSAFIQPQIQPVPLTSSAEQTTATPQPQKKKPFFIGVVKNNKKIPLPGILIYVKDQTGNAVRLLKTNPHGIFATYGQLPPGNYVFDIKDPKGIYFFDTITIQLETVSTKPIEIYSKELL